MFNVIEYERGMGLTPEPTEDDLTIKINIYTLYIYSSSPHKDQTLQSHNIVAGWCLTYPSEKY